MPNQLPLPDELKLLLEKREADRRAKIERPAATERRDGNDRRQEPPTSQSVRYRPGDSPDKQGIYRCEHCLEVVRVRSNGYQFRPCGQCGNQDQPWFELIATC